MNEETKKLARAEFSGILEVGESELPCFVLSDGKRIFSTRGMLASLDYNPNSNANEIFKSNEIATLLPDHKRGVVKFITPNGSLAHGYDVEHFMELCHALSKAHESGQLQNERNVEAALKANAIIRACSKIGIIALVDEATGYQYARAEDALQFKLKLYLSEEMRGWEKTFPDDLWKEFARLTHWGGQPTKNRPRYWGYLVMELIYRYLDKDVAQYLKENKPTPRKGRNYHQWLNDNYGLQKLIEHINRVIGMAQACESMDELKDKMAFTYGRQPLQMELFLEKQNRQDALKINETFDEAMKKISKIEPPDESKAKRAD